MSIQKLDFNIMVNNGFGKILSKIKRINGILNLLTLISNFFSIFGMYAGQKYVNNLEKI
jgi:hypothetical protein